MIQINIPKQTCSRLAIFVFKFKYTILINFYYLHQVCFMVMDMIIRKDDRAIVNGIVNIMDMDTLSMGHIVQMTPSFVKKVTLCFEVTLGNFQ